MVDATVDATIARDYLGARASFRLSFRLSFSLPGMVQPLKSRRVTLSQKGLGPLLRRYSMSEILFCDLVSSSSA